MTEIDVVLPVRARLGECPIWDPRSGRLWWIDVESKHVHRTDPSSGTDEVIELAGRPGSIVLTDDEGRLVAGMEHDIVDVDVATGATTLRVTVEAHDRPTRLNDGRCDPLGRFWVGSMQEPIESGTFAGGLYRVDADHLATADVHVERADGVGITNGAAFSPDGSTMYWADSLRNTVWSYDYDLDTGHRSNERVFATFGGVDAPGSPDGAAVDGDGCYWVACVMAGAVARFTPDGRLDRLIDVPCPMPTMPAFGGADLQTLFVTSIGGDGGTASDDDRYPLAGALFAIDVGVTGQVEPRFASA